MTDESQTANLGPLHGVRVIDLTAHAAGPIAAMVLGDLGADVIKVEHTSGDSNRQTGVTFPGGWSTFFLSTNRNKRFVAIDYRVDQGRQLIRQLVRGADVFLENARPGSWERHGLGYEDLKKVNERLVYGSISGFGHEGPMRDWLSMDPIAQATGGLLAITGTEEGGPAKIGAAISDVTSGRLAAFGVVAALFERERTGLGQKVETSLFAAATSILPMREVEYQFTQQVPPRTGTAHGQTAPNQVYRTADGGGIMLACHVPSHFRRWLEIAGHPEIADDPRFATNEARMANLEATTEMVQAIVLERTEAEWTSLLAGQVPFGPVLDFEHLFSHPQIKANGGMIDFEMPEIGTVHTMGSPVQFSNYEIKARHVPAPIGTHTLEVLNELGIAPEEFEELETAGVIRVSELQVAR